MQKNTDVLVVGVALFAMFFGAGNLIFPPYMGLLAGTAWSFTLIGFLITGIGMPLLGIMATARAGGSVEHLGSRVNPLFGRIMSIVVILAIGPLLAIPRTCAVSFEMAVRPTFPGFSPALFSLIFFSIVFVFALKRSAVVDRIGKYLTPFLVLTLAFIIFRGITSPVGSIGEGTLEAPFAQGFTEGYQTMDAMASIVFAKIIIMALVFKGYTNLPDQIKMASLAGVIAATGLGLVYGGLMYIGSTAGSIYPTDVERTTLLIGIAELLLGGGGKMALGLAVGLACLTTAIGLTATVGEYFSGITGDRISYNTVCIITVVFSGVFATVGVTTIVNVAYPLLVLVYPVTISLIVLTLMGKIMADRSIYAGAVIGALAVSIFGALNIVGLPVEWVNGLISYIPLADAGFAWMVPAAVGALAGGLYARFGQPAPIASGS